MKKKHFLGAASGITAIAGVIGIILLSSTGFSISALMDPSFHTGLMQSTGIIALIGFAFIGISLGALFSATRFLNKIESSVFAAITSLIIVVIGTIFFWEHVNSYTVVALGYFVAVALVGFFSSAARGSGFSIGFDHAKKVVIVTAIIAFLGTVMVVSADTENYENQLMSGITGMGVIAGNNIDNATIEEMIKEQNPKISWETFKEQVAPGYDVYTETQQEEVQGLYQNYSQEYDDQVALAIQKTREGLNQSFGAAETIIESNSFFKLMRDNLGLFYGVIMFFTLTMSGIVIAPTAGLTSWAFNLKLPKPTKPKEEYEPIWDEEKELKKKIKKN